MLKTIGALAAAVLVVFLATGSELALHFGTTALVLAASAICFFAKARAVRAQALAFLFLTVGVSHAVDRYFWVGVWERGYPWPYSHGGDCTSCGGFIGSIAPFMNEVATVCFSVLALVAAIAVAWHLSRNTNQVIDLQRCFLDGFCCDEFHAELAGPLTEVVQHPLAV
ncbi:hypothetical protein KGA65_03070, partial [Ideonella sp. B7]|uniref:hypothetical protein n=1 Tax=Ideonella benzenivorans TaxID=2831643 RepID=UPI001CEC2F95